MTDLELKIKRAAQAYYEDGSSDLTDEEFDALVDQLRKEQPDSELLRIGWGYETDIDSTPGNKIKHLYGTAGSLDKCRTWEEISKDLKNKAVDVSLKLDGISVVLYYLDSELQMALTRGDGEIGIDITEKVVQIFPSNLRGENFTGAIRGEILMSLESFEKFKEVHPEAKNPRNSTAGIINGKDTAQDLKYLNLVVYTIVGQSSDDPYDGAIDNVAAIRNRLVNMVGADRVVPSSGVINLYEDSAIQKFHEYREKWYGKYPADGLVVTAYPVVKNGNEVVYNAQAFKFPAEQKECEVVEVEWNMTKTRYAMPKIHIKPVQLSGTTVEYCTAYNAQYVKENGIGPGAILKVQKRGEIIPNVDEVVKPAEPQMITHCPDCGHELVWNSVHLQCVNSNCSNAIQQDTLIWMENIAPKDGLGDKIKLAKLQYLCEKTSMEDISVESVMEAKISLATDTTSAHQNLFAEMWIDLHNKQVPMVKALLALNIPRIGGITAIKFAQYEDLIWTLCDIALLEEKTLPLSVAVQLGKCIGQANTQSIEDNLWKFARLDYLRKRIVKSGPAVESKGKVAITGKLSIKRSDFENELRRAGYTPGEISKDTKFLITDDPDSSSSKNKKADQWGIKKITEQEFRKLYL